MNSSETSIAAQSGIQPSGDETIAALKREIETLKERNAAQAREIANLRERNAALVEKCAALETMNSELSKSVEELRQKNESQKITIDNLQRMAFGRKSEKIVDDKAQMRIPGIEDHFDTPETTDDGKSDDEKSDNGKSDDGKSETEKSDDGKADDGKSEKSGKGRTTGGSRRGKGQKKAGWNSFPAYLTREEKIIDLPEAKRKGLTFIGYEVSERLVYRKAYIVQVVKRATYKNLGASGARILTANSPSVPSCLSADTNRCHYDASVVAHVIAAKVVDHFPFDRQSMMFARLEIRFGRSAMCTYFAKVATALKPLYELMVKIVMACDILHADETHVRMLVKGGTKTCWIWVRKTGFGPPLTVFHFSLDRSSKTARELFKDYIGTILSDRYIVYDNLPAESAGCWAHCRRHFFLARDTHPEYADRALALVARLYALESLAKEASKDAEDAEETLFEKRRQLRAMSAPLVDQYFELCGEIAGKEPPSSPIAKAAAYSSKQEEALRRFLTNEKLNIDNNPCENVIRPFCIGRKNWLFVGSEDGGAYMAMLASFAATCKDNGVDFEEWLHDVMYRLDTCPASDLSALLPHIWKENRK